jgi:hypothetical protein
MKFLIDTSPATMANRISSPLVSGQLLTPLTRYSNWGGEFGIDNGAFSNFDLVTFQKLIEREKPNISQCKFVAVPDVVGNARRTLEIFKTHDSFVSRSWPIAMVAQNGIEDLDIPWWFMQAIFIGGGDPWKDSNAVADIVKTALILGKHVHVGRVNTIKRFRRFHELGAHTCDGSGVAMYDHMLRDIEREMNSEPDPGLFDDHKDDAFEYVEEGEQ